MTENDPPRPYWAVARSEEVTATKPLSVDIGDQPLVLWRDRHGIARALEDRCPHRRAPLSRGCVRDNGWLQCGYHGWSYDGETGRLQEVPNMKDKQKFPPLYRAMAFDVREDHGFVRVSLDGTGGATSEASTAEMLRLSGTVHVGLAHEQYVAALFDGPSLLIAIRGIAFTPYLMSELHVQNGWLVMERACQRRPFHWPAAFSPEFPAMLVSRTHPLTGETRFVLRDSQLNELLHAVLAPVPAARGVTAIRWRAELVRRARRLHHGILDWGNPLTVHDSVDAAALRALKPTASLHGAQLKAELLRKDAVEAA